METNNSSDPVVSVSDSDGSNLNKRDDEAVINVNGNNDKLETSELVNKPTGLLNEKGNEGDENNDDDQVSVIIEESENKTIELNEDSGEESEPNLDQSAGNISTTPNNSLTKATEFVIVNAASTTVPEVASETEGTNRYAIEDIQIKDELAESITADLNTNDVLENDPMDLLELNTRSECTSSTRSQDDTEDYGDDVSSIGSSSVQTGSSSTISILDWIKYYPWLLYEDGDDGLGYCLYCDAKVNTKSQRSVKQHGLSLYHKERCENYLAFRDEEEKNGLSMKLVEVKEEFGTDSRVEALKLKRKSQSAALNNFNWRRWLEDNPWLERDSPEGTTGFCKYCLIHVNVEFSYIRERHQESVKHREAEKQYEESIKARKQNKPSNGNEEKKKESAVDDSQQKNQRWLELVENEPSMVRCKICGTKMLHNNFLRHLRTNLHEHNQRMYLQSQRALKQKELEDEPTKSYQNWKTYTKHHPWLVSDPTDPTFAYCKYCEKRIIYGSSAAKRATHENSSQHKYNEVEYKKRSRKSKTGEENEEKDTDKEHQQNINDDDKSKINEEEEEEDQSEENDEDDGDDEEDNEDENDGSKDDEENAEEEEEEEEEVDNDDAESPEEKESEDDNESKKRVYKKLTDEWINQYPWCKRYKKDPTNFIFCIYCKIPLSVSYSRTKHQSTSFHISAEKEFLDRESKKQKIQGKKQSNENAPFYEWAIHLKNNPSSYSCRYCRVRISKNYSKKQHESSKIHQINESIYKNNRRKSLRKDENSNSNISQQPTNVAPTKKIQTFAKVVIKAPSTVTLIKQWQKKFPWLTYKRSELRSHYGYCKVCDASLYIRSLKHVLRHVRSGRHIRIMKANKKQKVEQEQEVGNNETSLQTVKTGSKEELETTPTPNDNTSQSQTKLATAMPASTEEATMQHQSQKAYSYKSTIAEMKKRFSWIENSERPNYAFCRFCNTNIPLKILFLKNHSNSHKHRHCVINYYYNDGKKLTREASKTNNTDLENESKCVDADDDIMILEENNEEILISEQDENWTVKSEPMDEHEELDYLLQRSFNTNNNTTNVQRNVRRSVNAEDNPPPKRLKHSQSFRRLNDSNTSLVASLLTTPLTLASCLGPLIQQQIQQQANVSQVSQGKPSSSTATGSGALETHASSMSEPENTYDLFFKSVSETMKKLPVDLAAEGKLRVMQIICDLELQALKRQQSTQSDSASSNTSCGLSYQATSTSTGINPSSNSSVVNETNAEQNIINTNETIITQLNVNTDVSPPSNTHLPSKVANSAGLEKPAAASPSPIIGVMDKNGLQTLQFKTAVSKQIPRNTTTTSITTVANSGIRCIPFKNLSQATAPETSNAKITRIQVPMNVPNQTTNQNTNAANASKNLLNFRNIQITKRLTTPPTSVSPATGPQQTVKQTSTMANKSPQRTYITNIQPQLQRWGCSVNGATPHHHTPTSSAVNHLQQLSSQQTSTPISKK